VVVICAASVVVIIARADYLIAIILNVINIILITFNLEKLSKVVVKSDSSKKVSPIRDLFTTPISEQYPIIVWLTDIFHYMYSFIYNKEYIYINIMILAAFFIFSIVSYIYYKYKKR